jgi:hypothetical protein
MVIAKKHERDEEGRGGREEEEKTVDDVIREERCAIPRSSYNEITTLASAAKRSSGCFEISSE